MHLVWTSNGMLAYVSVASKAPHYWILEITGRFTMKRRVFNSKRKCNGEYIKLTLLVYGKVPRLCICMYFQLCIQDDPSNDINMIFVWSCLIFKMILLKPLLTFLWVGLNAGSTRWPINPLAGACILMPDDSIAEFLTLHSFVFWFEFITCDILNEMSWTTIDLAQWGCHIWQPQNLFLVQNFRT